MTTMFYDVCNNYIFNMRNKISLNEMSDEDRKGAQLSIITKVSQHCPVTVTTESQIEMQMDLFTDTAIQPWRESVPVRILFNL